MAAKKNDVLWVVRVACDEKTELSLVTSTPWLEQLRYAGLALVHDTKTPAGFTVFDLFPPKSMWSDSYRWSCTNAERMRSFSINAVAAPAGSPADAGE